MSSLIRTAIVFTLCTILFMACNENGTDSPVTPEKESSYASLGKPASHFLVEFSGNANRLVANVQSVGGHVDEILGAIDAAKVSGLNDQGAAALRAMPGIQYVTRDAVLQWAPDLFPSGAQVRQVTGSVMPNSNPANAIYFGFQWALQAIQAPAAWQLTTGNSEIRVAVIDCGISPTHIDLVGKYDLSTSINLSEANPNDPSDYHDRFGHGSCVSAVISSNCIGMAGVAPDVTLVGIKVLDDNGSAPTANVLTGILYAVDVADCDIINLSLGGYDSRVAAGRSMSLIHRALNYARRKGAIAICAAGNDALDLDRLGPIACMPAEAGASVAVSATGPTFGQNPDAIACYSNYGSSVIHLAAPGGNFDCATGLLHHLFDLVFTVYPPAMAAAAGLPNPDTYYGLAAGTSLAAPHVSGVASLIIDAKGNSNPGFLRTRLQSTADDLGAPGMDPYYGHGRLNAYEAVK